VKTIRNARRAGLRTTGTVAEAQVDAWGAAQYEIALNLITDEGARSRFVLNTTAAIELGQALIAEAAVCARNSDAATEFDNFAVGGEDAGPGEGC